MTCNATTIGGTVGNDNPYSHDGRDPTAITDDFGGQSTLAIDRAHQVADVDDVGLQLDDEQGPRLRVPRHDVHDSAFAADRERDFRRHLPAGKRQERPSHRLMQRAVASIQHRSRSPPCQRGTRSTLPPSASKMRATDSTLSSRTRPRSSIQTASRGTRATRLTSLCRRPFLIRIARAMLPSRTPSIARTLTFATYL